jgi:hypothetical protein
MFLLANDKLACTAPPHRRGTQSCLNRYGCAGMAFKLCVVPDRHHAGRRRRFAARAPGWTISLMASSGKSGRRDAQTIARRATPSAGVGGGVIDEAHSTFLWRITFPRVSLQFLSR